MDQAEATKFVAEWERAWNAHDLDSLLGHFSDAVVFTSPVAAQILPDCDGVIHGKEALRRYWAEGLRRIPDLRFEVEAVYAGVRTIVINYHNQAGAASARRSRSTPPWLCGRRRDLPLTTRDASAGSSS